MRWIRVTIHDWSKLQYPDVCANCLQSPADTLTPIVRSVGGPFVGAITTHAVWPLCARCSTWTTRSARWCKRYAITPAGILASLALIAALFRTPGGLLVSPLAMWLLVASFVLAVVGCFLATIAHWFARRPDSCISNFPPVKPLRGGQVMFSRRTFAVLEFLHPLYVEALIAMNDPDNFKYNIRRLEKAKVLFTKWAAKRATSPSAPA